MSTYQKNPVLVTLLVEVLDLQIEKMRSDIRAWAKKVLETDNPGYEIKWADGAVETSAALEVTCQVREYVAAYGANTSPRIGFDEIAKVCNEGLMRNSSSFAGSTSFMSNMYDIAKVKAWSRAADGGYNTWSGAFMQATFKEDRMNAMWVMGTIDKHTVTKRGKPHVIETRTYLKSFSPFVLTDKIEQAQQYTYAVMEAMKAEGLKENVTFFQFPKADEVDSRAQDPSLYEAA